MDIIKKNYPEPVSSVMKDAKLVVENIVISVTHVLQDII